MPDASFLPSENRAPGASTAHPSAHPGVIVWLLQGARLGDNQQVLALGAALEARFGWHMIVKQLRFHAAPEPGCDLAQALCHVDLEESDPIRPRPGEAWPHVVIAIGRRAAPVARWIRQQAAPFAVHIQLGRFQDSYAAVDLLVTTAQYGLPAAPNVLHLSLPITARRAEAPAEAGWNCAPEIAGEIAGEVAGEVAGEIAGIGGPAIGVLVGGPSSPMQFDLGCGQRLLKHALAFAEARGGTLLIATSPRTPAEVVAHLKANLPPPHRLFPFEPGAGSRNPYPALLSRCDAFVVTSDSVSMVADAALTGREVRLFDLPVKRPAPLWTPSWPLSHWVGRRRNQRLRQGLASDLADRWFEAAVRRGRAQPVRYVPILISRLLRERHVARLDETHPPRTRLAQLMAQELDMVAARIVALLAEKRAVALREALRERAGMPGSRKPSAMPALGPLPAAGMPA